ncbi:MAG: beta-galactosidase [Candidatus Glassbacteria bacterium]|nr:beta-galactosidase [Candidatus Glassbacteria bacterium]
MCRIILRTFPSLLFLAAATLQAQAAKIEKFLPAEVRVENGIAGMYLDGRPVMPMSFCSRNNQDERYLAGLLNAGIKVHFPICDTDWRDPQGFEKLEALAHRILKLDPQAILILRLSLDPPVSWMEDNLDQCTMFENGSVRMIIDKKIGRTYDPQLTDNLKFCLASRKWRQKAGEALTDFALKVGRSDFGHRVAGYFLTASETEEWYYTVRYDRRYHAHDFSKPMLEYFREFLRRKYGTDQALASAWNNDVRGFDSVRVPQLAERSLYTGVGEILLRRFESKSHFGTLANPDFSEFESDYYRAVNHSVAEAIVSFCARLKELSGGRMLTGAFYGSQSCVVYHEMGVSAAVHKIQDSGVVDICASPASYFNRPLGGQAAHRGVHSSFALHGMLWMTEEDTRTHLCDPRNWTLYSQAGSAEESCRMIKRDFAKTLTGYNWAWWFENSHTDRWYDDPLILDTFRRIQQVFQASRRLGLKRTAEIAVINSEESIYYTDHESLRDMLMWQRQLEFERIGAPFDNYYVRDLENPAMPDYKLYVFVNAVCLDDRERGLIREKIIGKGAAVLWLYAPGLINPDREPRLSPAHMEELTGFSFGFRTGRFRPRIVVDDPRHPLTAGLPRDRWFGIPDRPIYGSFETRLQHQIYELTPSLLDPVFFLADSSQVAGGYFYDDGLEAGLGAIGETGRAGYRSMYYGGKYTQSAVLRAAAGRAGVHLYSLSDDTFYADANFAVIHARTGGTKRLVFPQPVDCYEVFEKKSYGRKVKELVFGMAFGETRVFCLKGKI